MGGAGAGGMFNPTLPQWCTAAASACLVQISKALETAVPADRLEELHRNLPAGQHRALAEIIHRYHSDSGQSLFPENEPRPFHLNGKVHAGLVNRIAAAITPKCKRVSALVKELGEPEPEILSAINESGGMLNVVRGNWVKPA